VHPSFILDVNIRLRLSLLHLVSQNVQNPEQPRASWRLSVLYSRGICCNS
jgi:hypothetical protein